MNNALNKLLTEVTITTPETGPLGLDHARDILRKTLKRHPQLILAGFVTKLNARFYAESRKEILEDINVTAFIKSRTWLAQYPKQKAFNQIATSYGWKHKAERDCESYFPNGVFIAAAIAEGFKLQRVRGTPNALLNIQYGRKSHNRWH